MLHETCVILAETLSDPTPCLPPGFSGPVSTALGWVKALSLVIGVVALVALLRHPLMPVYIDILRKVVGF